MSSAAANTILPGDHAPWFQVPALEGAQSYMFHTIAGRHVLMLFFGSARIAPAAKALNVVLKHRDLFDDERASFFGVTADPQDAAKGRIRQELPGLRYFLDFDRKVSSLYGAASGTQYRPYWLILDPGLRVVARFALDAGEEAIALLRSLTDRPEDDAWAPVLAVKDVLEPEICRTLIGQYEAGGGTESGFMRDVGGKTVRLLDAELKQRRDHPVTDEELRRAIAVRLNRRLVPAIQRAFQFDPTRIERYVVACYEAGAGHFRPHRDNTTKATAHRKFAVTINLNAGEYEGGDLRFPEFGSRTYRAPTGGAIVFSCSVLHEATPVTEGRRYAFLPFLYDEEGARIRAANNEHLGEGVAEYRPI